MEDAGVGAKIPEMDCELSDAGEESPVAEVLIWP